MTKIISTILSIAFVLLSATGCSEKTNNANTSSMDWTSNPFSTDMIDEGTTLDGGYGFGLISPVEEMSYDGNSIEIPLWFKNSVVPIDVGIYIFIDGVAQQYTIKNTVESTDLLQQISLKKEEQKEITLTFTPTVGKRGDILELNILTLMNPLYIPTGENKSFGNQHAALPSMPIKLSFQADTINEYPKLTENSVSKNMSDEIIKAYQINSGQLTNTVRLYDNADNIEDSILFSSGNKLDLSIAAYGNNATKYRTTVFVNHKPIKTIEEISGFDFEIKKDYLTEIKFQADTSSFGKDNFIYAISVPITNSANSRIIKTQSALLLNESEVVKDDSSTAPEKSSSVPQQKNIETSGTKFDGFYKERKPSTYIDFVDKNKVYIATADELLLIDTLTKKTLAKATLPKQIGMMRFYRLDNGIGLAYTIDNSVDNSTSRSEKFVVEAAAMPSVHYISFDKSLKQIGSSINLTDLLAQENDTLLNFNAFCVSKDGENFAFISGENDSSNIYLCKANDLDKKSIVKSVGGKDNKLNNEVSSFSAIQFIDSKTIAFTGYGTVDSKKAQGFGTVGIDGSRYVQKRNDTVEYPQTAGGIAFWGDKNVELHDQSSGIVSVISDGTIKLLHPKSKNESQNCCLSNDAKYYATYQISNSSEVEITLHIYDVASDSIIKEIIEHPKGASFNSTGVYSIALNGEGREMLVQYQFGERFEVRQYIF